MKQRKEKILRIRVIRPPANPEHIRLSVVQGSLIRAPFELFDSHVEPDFFEIRLNYFGNVYDLLVLCDVEGHNSSAPLFFYNFSRLIRIILMCCFKCPVPEEIGNRTSGQPPPSLVKAIK